MTDIDQGTPEWFAARCGRVTASRIADVIAKTKSGPSTSRANYAAQLVTERLTGTVGESFSNAAMAWGTEKEPEARDAYAFQEIVSVDQVGFVLHPSITLSGASPDGVVGTDGLVEIKCPNTATHIATLLDGKVPDKYQVQMLWQMACTERHWCDFVSYDPRMPVDMQLFVQRVPRDDVRIAELEAEVRSFIGEVDAMVDKLTARYGPRSGSVSALSAG